MGCLVRLILALLALLLLLGAAALAIYCFYARPRFGALPEGERLARVEASPHYRDGAFHNIARPCGLPLPPGELPWTQQQEKRSFPQILWEALVGSGKPGEKPERPLPVAKADWATMPRDRDVIVWYGHSTCLLQLGGARILVDPVFGTASPIPGINRAFAGTDALSAEDLPPVEVLLITHDHYDHLDRDTVRALRERVGRVVCPLGVGAHLERWGYPAEQISELDWGEQIRLPGLSINAHTAYHYSGRQFNTRRRALWASYVVQGHGRTIFLGGDSGYATHFAAIGRQYGRIDYAVMENGQYNTTWHQNHMLPHELPHALRDLGARRVLTVHHSKYKLSPHPWAEPLENALKLREAGFRVDIPRMGEPVWLDEEPRVEEPWWR